MLATELGEDARAGGLPSTIAEVVAIAEQTEGVRLGELLAALQPDPRAVEEALAGILRAAAELPPDDTADIAGYLERWEAVIAAVAAACRGDQEAVTELEPVLGEVSQSPDWAALAGVLRRILDGERGTALLDGLDSVDTAIVRETLRRVGGDGGEPAA